MNEDYRTYNRDGISLAQQGRFAEAAVFFEKALRLEPRYAPLHNNLGNVLVFQGRYDDAAASFTRSLELMPDDPETHNNLSNAYRLQGRLEEAAACCRQALRLRPHFAEAHNNLGVAVELLGKLDEAEACYREAIRLIPQFADAHNHLGNLYRQMGRFEEAITCGRHALELSPDSAEAHNNIGAAYMALGHSEQALKHGQRAIELNPNLGEAYCNLANVYTRRGRLADAHVASAQALRLKPDLIDVQHNLGVLAMKEGRIEEALVGFDKLLREKPDCAQAHVNRAMALLLRGDYEEGWSNYEWRWKCKDFGLVPVREPFWDGRDLHGKTVLLGAEQGLGDTVQFIRYARLAKDRGAARVIVACQGALIPFLRDCEGVDQLVSQDFVLPPFDEYAPLLSLPHILKKPVLDAPKPYLFADAALVARWRGEFENTPGFKIGIAWQGSLKHLDDYLRSIPLKAFAPLARVPDVRLFSLQKGPGIEQLRECPFAVTDLGPRLDNHAGAFVDTAALMMSLDLVITSDTAIAHVAGALGVSVWVALPTAPDWRWMMEREDTPWYPTMRLFRQSRLMEWGDVFERMASALPRNRSKQTRVTSVSIEVAPGELIDKITILQIKGKRIADPDKLRHIQLEMKSLLEARDRSVQPSKDLTHLTEALERTNEALWDIEDELRACEKRQDFGSRFVELARSVPVHNDERAALKRQINELLGARWVEEKSYGAEPAAGRTPSRITL